MCLQCKNWMLKTHLVWRLAAGLPWLASFMQCELEEMQFSLLFDPGPNSTPLPPHLAFSADLTALGTAATVPFFAFPEHFSA